jgi:hypothetical protein
MLVEERERVAGGAVANREWRESIEWERGDEEAELCCSSENERS